MSGLPSCGDRSSVYGATNNTTGAGGRPWPSNWTVGLCAPRSQTRVSRAQVAATAAPAGRPRARGGASRVPFKRPHPPPLTSGCLSAPARVPRRSAPRRPQPRRRHDERWRPGPRVPPGLGAPAPLYCRFLPAPAVARLRASSRTMSVAGLKKQFHKATQVRRVTGAPRGGPGRSCEGGLPSAPAAARERGDPCLCRSRPAAPRASCLVRRGIPGLETRPRLPPYPGSVPLCGHPRIPGVPPSSPARRLRTS